MALAVPFQVSSAAKGAVPGSADQTGCVTIGPVMDRSAQGDKLAKLQAARGLKNLLKNLLNEITTCQVPKPKEAEAPNVIEKVL